MTSPVEFTMEEMRTICSSALFTGCAPLVIAQHLTQFETRRRVWQNGDVVADETTAVTRMGLLLSGFLHIYDSAFKGERHLVRIVRPGEFVGTTLVGVQQKAHPARVTAFGTCVAATFSLAGVSKLLKSGGGVVFDNIAAIVRDEMQASWRKIAILSCPNIPERVMLTLQDIGRRTKRKTFAIGSTEAAFADYLGVSRPALANALRRMAKEGRFSYKRDVFTLAVMSAPPSQKG